MTTARKGVHLAMYGNIGLVRAICPECDSWTIVIDHKTQCCDTTIEDDPKVWKRMIEPEFTRKTPPIRDQREILILQDNCCIYIVRGDLDHQQFERIN